MVLSMYKRVTTFHLGLKSNVVANVDFDNPKLIYQLIETTVGRFILTVWSKM